MGGILWLLLGIAIGIVSTFTFLSHRGMQGKTVPLLITVLNNMLGPDEQEKVKHE